MGNALEHSQQQHPSAPVPPQDLHRTLADFQRTLVHNITTFDAISIDVIYRDLASMGYRYTTVTDARLQWLHLMSRLHVALSSFMQSTPFLAHQPETIAQIPSDFYRELARIHDPRPPLPNLSSLTVDDLNILRNASQQPMPEIRRLRRIQPISAPPIPVQQAISGLIREAFDATPPQNLAQALSTGFRLLGSVLGDAEANAETKEANSEAKEANANPRNPPPAPVEVKADDTKLSTVPEVTVEDASDASDSSDNDDEKHQPTPENQESKEAKEAKAETSDSKETNEDGKAQPNVEDVDQAMQEAMNLLQRPELQSMGRLGFSALRGNPAIMHQLLSVFGHLGGSGDTGGLADALSTIAQQ